ncbi:MAG: sigma-70 family RNA polymerase sigma factor [Bacteroidales bacterium]|nr:sigma-70 family RNA polymerase sigma factor [Bacteroidales bacterium]MBN2749797.1 sigma-70 family RNA polymerase sigma factor [Bacteroidales bacterium]
MLEDISNTALFKGILGQEPNALEYLYSSFFPKVAATIGSLGGDRDDANDAFQEAVILFYRKAKANELDESVAVLPYLMSVSRIIFLKRIRDAKIDKGIDRDYVALHTDSAPVESEYIASKQKELFYLHFKKLSSVCQKVLLAFFEGLSFGQIAESMGFASEEYARRKKYLCKERLVERIKKDPLYKKLSEEGELYEGEY